MRPMELNHYRIAGMITLSLLLCWSVAMSQNRGTDRGDDKTLSPYFFVNSNDSTDRMPLASTAAAVVISGVIADVEVTQVYKNEGKHTLEAIYVFPGSTRAAVYAMRMTIGKRTIEAQIQEREKARQTYETALAEGKTASLLEQQRPNVFQMNVGNILPGDEITVKLNYTELLVPENSIYEFVYPTVVGPRYSNQTTAQADKQEAWSANPYLHEGKNAPFTFEFSCKINSGIPIEKLTSPSHEISPEFTGKNSAEVKIAKGVTSGNRDVVLRYCLAGDSIESGLLLNIGKKEDFFLLMLEPPKRINSSMIIPREYIFILDVSGSMHGFPIGITKLLIKDLLGSLRPSDFFNVMLFSGGNTVLSERSLPVNQENLQQAIDVIDRQQGGGGTELMPALRTAMTLPRAESNISRCIVIITDGYVTVEKEVFEYIAQNLGKGNVFSFGIGTSVNRFLIEGIAHAGMGEPFIVSNEKDANVKAEKLREYIDSPVLTDIKVDFDGLQTSAVEPVSIPDLFARKPVIVFGKYSGTPKGTITITGKTAGTPYKQEIRVSAGKISTENNALQYLWARHRILRLADMVKLTNDDQRIKEVTDLGLAYNLLTDYTSFVAVDKEKRADGKPTSTVRQPLPLPQGVSDMAVGVSMQQPLLGYGRQPAVMSLEKRALKPMRMPQNNSADLATDQVKMVKEKQPAKHSALPENTGNDGMSRQGKTVLAAVKMILTISIDAVTPPLDSAGIEKAFEAKRAEIEKMVNENGRTGVCRFSIDINSNGSVTKVAVKQNSFSDKGLVKKMTDLFKHMQFTVPGGSGGSVVVMLTAKKSQ